MDPKLAALLGCVSLLLFALAWQSAFPSLALPPERPPAEPPREELPRASKKERRGLYERAADCYAREDYASAERLLRELLRERPGHDEARRQLRKVEMLLGEREARRR